MNTMTVADYILDFFAAHQVDKVFLLNGGAIAFVIDAFSKRKDIRYVCMAHEQAAAMAADAYARMHQSVGVTMATSGPGATNLLTGIACSWFDSVPTIHITGQVNTYEQKKNTAVRQVGFQETDIVSMATPITKFAAQLERPEQIKFLLEKALYIATEGRPGPVLLDIPQDFQRAVIKPSALHGYAPQQKKLNADTLAKQLTSIQQLLQKAKRPVLLVGGGVRMANATKLLADLMAWWQWPVVTSWSGFDSVPNDSENRIGEIGVYGNRAANFAVQNADLIVSLGSRLDTRQTGGRPETFAREAKKIVVDIDPAELAKRRGLTPTVAIAADVHDVLQQLLAMRNTLALPNIQPWQMQCREWKAKYPTVLPSYFKQPDFVNPYVFFDTLSEVLEKDAVIIADTGAHVTWAMQALRLQQNQRLFSAFGNSPMGYALPAAIGASFALGKKPVISINGDGSLQINIQELQTIVHNKLPIKIFVFDNNGYGIIQQFQSLYLENRTEASTKGVSRPNFTAVGKAYGIKSIAITNHKQLRKKIKTVLAANEPVLCTIAIKQDQKIMPKLEFGKPIEDLSPPLPRAEFLKNMVVKPLNNG